MNGKLKVAATLVLITPLIAELLSGSTKVNDYVTVAGFLFLTVTYGVPILFIRELKAWTGTNWSLLYLAPLMAFFQEGLLMQSFFNPGFAHMGSLAFYGMAFGVQWMWTIKLILYHAVLSVATPILIVDLLWPQYRFKRILTLPDMGILAILAAIVSAFIIREQMRLIAVQTIPYAPHALAFVGLFLVTAALVFLATTLKGRELFLNSNPVFHPASFLFAGFAFRLVNFYMQDTFAKIGLPIMLAVGIQIAWMIGVGLFVYYQLYNKNLQKTHVTALIVGIMLFSAVDVSVESFRAHIEFTIYATLEFLSALAILYWRHYVLAVQARRLAGNEKTS